MSEATDFQEFMRRREVAARAYVNGDPGPVDAMSTTHSPATFFGPDDSVVSGPARIGTAFKNGAEMFAEGGDTTVEVLQAHQSGDVAFWCGLQHATVRLKSDGSRVEMPLRITEFFRREGSEWKLVHRHADMRRHPGGEH